MVMKWEEKQVQLKNHYNGVYSKKKKLILLLLFFQHQSQNIFYGLLDEPKPNKDYIYHYKDGSGWKFKGTPYNTAGWTSVEGSGQNYRENWTYFSHK